MLFPNPCRAKTFIKTQRQSWTCKGKKDLQMASFFGKKNKLSNDLFVEASYVQFSIVQLIYKNTDEKKFQQWEQVTKVIV